LHKTLGRNKYFSLLPLINTSVIEADGGKLVQLADGRIVKYFIVGSTSPNATILLDCHDGYCSGKFFTSISEWLEKHQ
jgi:hypothetical protein